MIISAVQYDCGVGWLVYFPAELVIQVPKLFILNPPPAFLKCISPLSYCKWASSSVV